ncbi:MAG: T9SS type A sorting domain-containing protein [Chlorobi bacterium]|nr:T9SS type A sorting domain-containing protein [Chlorobiota bacterium]
MRKIILSIAVLLSALVGMQAQTVTENFDSYTNGSVPTGWTSYTTQTDDPGFTVVTDTGIARSPYNFLAHKGVDISQESTSWIVSPAINVPANQELIFYWREKWSYAYNYSGVYISTGSNDPINNPDDFTELAEFDPNDYPDTWNTWNKAMFDLSSYENQTVYIAFKYVGDFAHDFYVDDIQVSNIPYCNPTTDIDVVSYTDSTLVVSWDAVTDQDTYEIVWGPVGFDPDSATAVTVTGTSYTITGLSPATWYDIYVRTACSPYNYSSWSGPEAGRTSGPPPANDTCGGAIDLTVYPALGGSAGHEIVGDTWDATASSMSQTSCDSYGTNLDLFYTFTAPSGGSVVILTDSTQGRRIEAAVYDTCGGNEIACFGQSNRKVVTGLTPGQSYVLQVWHDDYNKGVFTIALEELPPPPANDNCDGAELLTVGSSCNPVQGDNTYATDSGVSSPGCANYSGGDLWYKLVVPASGSLVVETSEVAGSDLRDTGLAVYSGDCGNLTLIDCDDDGGASTFSSIRLLSQTPGDTLYVRVWEYGNDRFGPFNICAYEIVVQVPANDNCSGALEVEVAHGDGNCHPVYADNTYATDSGIGSPGCANYQGGDLWFKAVVPSTGNITIESTAGNSGSVRDTGIAAYSGDCGNLSIISCDDDGGASLFSKIELTGQTPGDTIYIRVWEYGNNSFGEIGVCAYDPSVSVEELQAMGFAFYPNPTNGQLVLSAERNIERVYLTNLTGQILMKREGHADHMNLDISSLPAGIYLMHVRIDGKEGTYRVVKE